MPPRSMAAKAAAASVAAAEKKAAEKKAAKAAKERERRARRKAEADAAAAASAMKGDEEVFALDAEAEAEAEAEADAARWAHEQGLNTWEDVLANQADVFATAMDSDGSHVDGGRGALGEGAIPLPRDASASPQTRVPLRRRRPVAPADAAPPAKRAASGDGRLPGKRRRRSVDSLVADVRRLTGLVQGLAARHADVGGGGGGAAAEASGGGGGGGGGGATGRLGLDPVEVMPLLPKGTAVAVAADYEEEAPGLLARLPAGVREDLRGAATEDDARRLVDEAWAMGVPEAEEAAVDSEEEQARSDRSALTRTQKAWRFLRVCGWPALPDAEWERGLADAVTRLYPFSGNARMQARRAGIVAAIVESFDTRPQQGPPLAAWRTRNRRQLGELAALEEEYRRRDPAAGAAMREVLAEEALPREVEQRRRRAEAKLRVLQAEQRRRDGGGRDGGKRDAGAAGDRADAKSGVCFRFRRDGRCARGAECKYSHTK